LDAQPSVASTRLPEGAAPKVSAPVQGRRAHVRTPTTRTLEGSWSRRRSSRGSGGSEQACIRGDSGYTTPAASPVPALPGAMVSAAHAVLQPAGHAGLDPHSQTRPG